MIDFAVMGLPRSGTTWVANWLTTDRSFCLHDPWLYGNVPAAWPAPKPDRLFGISCTGSYVYEGWMKSLTCPIVKIIRDPNECEKSLAKFGFVGFIPRLDMHFASVNGLTIHMENLWKEDCARLVWNYLLHQIPFDDLRYRQLVDMHITPCSRVVEKVRRMVT